MAVDFETTTLEDLRGWAGTPSHPRPIPVVLTNYTGTGLLSGSFPLSLITAGGDLPSRSEVRIIYRPKTGDSGDGLIVGTTFCNADGSWQVGGLNPNLKFDIVARIPGFNDVIISDVQPSGAPLSAHFANLKEEYEYGEEVNIQVVAMGGRPPYTFTVIELPEGLSIDLSTGYVTGNISGLFNQVFKVEVKDSENTVVNVVGSTHVAGDPYWDSVVALLRFESALLEDETGRAWTLLPGTTLDLLDPIYGTGSLRCAGLDHGCETPNPISNPNADFTIESTVIFTALPGPVNPNGGTTTWLWSQPQNTGAGEYGLRLNGSGSNIRLYLEMRGGVGGPTFSSDLLEVETGKKYHVAQTYEGGLHRVFLDGVKVIEGAHSVGWRNTDRPFTIGRSYLPSYSSYRGGSFAKYDEFRITRGVARYTKNFNPPTGPFPSY